MKFEPNNDIYLVLNLTDRRGKKIRANMCNDLKVKVWTNDVNKFLAFGLRDIQQHKDYDAIAIPDFMMEALPSGVVMYEYKYNTYSKDFESSDHKFDRSHVVTTDIYWKNKNISEKPSNPINYQSLEYLKDLIDRERTERIKADKDLNHYVSEVYTNALEDEVERATYREDELEDKINSSNEKVSSLENKLNEEIERSNQVDIEMFKYIKEVESKSGGNKEEQDKKNEEIEKEIDTTKEDLTKLVEAEKERAEKAEKELDNKIEENNNKFNLKDIELNSLIEAEVSRSKTEEARIETKVETESDRAKEQEKHLQSDIDDEVKRAKAKEEELYNLIVANTSKDTDLKDRVEAVEKTAENVSEKLEKHLAEADTTNSKLDAEITRSTNKDNELETSLNQEISRATIKENEIVASIENLDSTHKAELSRLESLINQEANRATEAEKHVTDDLNAEISRAKAKETELENSIAEINSNATELTQSVNDIQTALNEEISTRILRDNEVIASVEAEVSRAKTEEERIENKIDSVASNLTSETERAKLVESDLAQSLQQLKQSVNSSSDELKESVESLKSDLNAEISRSTNEDTRLNNLINIINGEESVNGSIKHSFKHSTDYTDSEISKLENSLTLQFDNALSQYATKEEVDGRIKDIIGTAPSALDTLGEIADRLAEDSDALKAINSVLNDKANADSVYTKQEIDNKVVEINSSISIEANRAKLVEETLTNLVAVINGGEEVVGSIKHSLEDSKHYTDEQIGLLQGTINNNLKEYVKETELTELEEKVDNHISESATQITDLTNSISQEVIRAKQEEQKLNNAIDVINGDENTIGSIKHCLEDSKHYTDDEIAKLKLEQNQALAGFATKNEVQLVQTDLDNFKEEVKDNYYTKEEIDSMWEWYEAD